MLYSFRIRKALDLIRIDNNNDIEVVDIDALLISIADDIEVDDIEALLVPIVGGANNNAL